MHLSALLFVVTLFCPQEMGAEAAADAPAPPEPPVEISTLCGRCHSSAPRASALRDASGREIGPYDLWQSSMMAASARDPLWRAVLSAEVDAIPSRQRDIEATCMRCHTPMADRIGLDDHDTGSLLHLLECDSRLGELARDGVSCTVCHGMSPEGLGTDASFSSGFVLNDERRMFGPHEKPFTMPMRHHTSFTPSFGEHVMRSAMCGSCHTVETEVFTAAGDDTGARFLEQAPYLEWRNSAFDTERAETRAQAASCQACHMPTVDVDGVPIETRIARNPGGRDFPPVRPRSPFGRHVFVGGNTLVLSMFRDHGEALGAPAPPEAYQATIDAARHALRHDTARLAMEDITRDGSSLSFDVVVRNLTGHKLPTAHPTRRVWLRVLVRDARGELLFASGDVDEAGRILGGDGRPLASETAGGPVQPHRRRIASPDEVALWRAVMADVDGQPTHTLVAGARWFVDNRLLPLGWSPDHVEASRTRPVGVDDDPDFRAGQDRVRIELQLGAAVDGPLSIEVDLLYQSLSARWAAELFERDTAEIRRFRALYEGADRTPEVLAHGSAGL